nr:hypothetical protein [Avibacterium paragallinarum]
MLLIYYSPIYKYKLKYQAPLHFDFLTQDEIEVSSQEKLHKTIVLIILAITLFCWLTSK